MNILNNKGPKIEPCDTPLVNSAHEFRVVPSLHAAGGGSGSPQEAHRQPSQHHKHGVSQSVNCGVNSQKLSTDPQKQLQS